MWGRAAAAVAAIGSVNVATAAEPPSVAASILPIHSLISGVMAGVAAPVILVAPGGSPHGYQMRPSEARALAGAELVFWVGESLETFLVKPLETLGQDATVIELLEAPGMELLATREGGVWDHEEHAGHEAHDHNEGTHPHAAASHAEEAGHAAGEHDAHVWLSPANARAIVATAASALAQADPERAGIYERNAAELRADLEALEAELRAELAPVKDRPFIVLHDAYQYLEHAFDLTAAGSITVSPERPPGAARIAELRERVVNGGATCLFSEPQLGTQLIETVVDGTPARIGELNPEGSADMEPGPQAYATLMRANARALVDCLARAS